MKFRAIYFYFVLMLMFSLSGQAQNQLDIAFEGPWIISLAADFDSKATVLVAIAPKVAGHNPLIFSTGDGSQVPLGTYCVGFDGRCKPNKIDKLNYGTYADPELIQVSPTTGWKWSALGSSAYVLILPMPDNYSSDGKYSMTFQPKFPVPPPPPTPPTVSWEPHSIGMMLHYSSGPKTVQLLQCSGVPSVATCSTSKSTQENSGTLRILIKSNDNPDPCDYHVHRAYHKMIKLLDPTGVQNPQRQFVDVPYYDDCSPCDPQQDLIPSDCTAMSMSAAAAIPDVPEALARLVAFLRKGALTSGQREQIHFKELESQKVQLAGKFPKQSELRGLKEVLTLSEHGIDKVLRELQDAAGDSGGLSLREYLQVAASEEKALSSIAEFEMLDALSGKDCRVGLMQVQ